MTRYLPEQDLDTCTRQNPYPIDLEDASEAARLTILNRVLTRHLGELVPAPLQSLLTMQVLDIGCGTGGWIHDIAYHYPKGEATGIDLSQMMIGLAQSGAQAQGLNNAFFERMDATQPLPFSDNTFDLVQARFCNSFLLTQTWPQVVREWVRVTRPGGYMRLIDSDTFGQSNDTCFEQMQHLLRMAWKTDPLGRVLPITPRLGSWLHHAGCIDVRERTLVLDFSSPYLQEEEEADEVQYERHVSLREALEAAFLLLTPFLLARQQGTPTEVDRLCQQAALGMRQPTFRGQWNVVEVVGKKPVAKLRA